MRRSRTNLYLTKISRSHVKGVMRYQGAGPYPPPPVSDVVPKPLVSEGLKGTIYPLLEGGFVKLLTDIRRTTYTSIKPPSETGHQVNNSTWNSKWVVIYIHSERFSELLGLFL